LIQSTFEAFQLAFIVFEELNLGTRSRWSDVVSEICRIENDGDG
jgi:hypothetical protein